MYVCKKDKKKRYARLFLLKYVVSINCYRATPRSLLCGYG